MLTSTATTKNSIEIPQRTVNRTAIRPSNPTAGHTHQGNQNWRHKSPVFIAALFTIARTRKQPRCPSADEWIRTLWYIHTMEYYVLSHFSRIWLFVTLRTAGSSIHGILQVRILEWVAILLLSYKKTAFESVLMRWMKLEPIIQSEVNPKKKHQYSILMYIYGIYKEVNNNPICKAAKETYM